LGDTTIANNFGKKGTTSDITIHDKKANDAIFSFCFANTYPEKLSPLLQSIFLSDYAILNVTKLDSFLGEQIIALDILKVKKGFILHSFDVDREKLENIVKTTNLSSFQIVDNLEELQKSVLDLGNLNAPIEKEAVENNYVNIPIDHVFDVKGVGTVALGSIKRGRINTYDELKLYPLNKTILIKSIQIHDDPVNTAQMPSRVGLAIKGASAKEISRGDVLSSISSEIVKIAEKQFEIKFTKNSYFKEEIHENQNYMITVGLQTRTVKLKVIDESNIFVTIEKPVAYADGDICVLFKPDSKTMRIVGHGIF
jgi:selenocysteine-specific translation elongation factor